MTIVLYKPADANKVKPNMFSSYSASLQVIELFYDTFFSLSMTSLRKTKQKWGPLTDKYVI